MRKSYSSVATILVVVVLLLVNVVAFNWTSKFFRSRYESGLLRYGDTMPKLEGLAYSGDRVLSIKATKPTLVLYVTAVGMKGQTIALLKFCESLRQQDPDLFQTALITAGTVPELQQLLRDNLIGYPIINDAEGLLGKRLGLEFEESGAFFFDKSGLYFGSDPRIIRALTRGLFVMGMIRAAHRRKQDNGGKHHLEETIDRLHDRSPTCCAIWCARFRSVP